MKFTFKAEYETLVLGLLMAKMMGATKVKVRADSQVVANDV